MPNTWRKLGTIHGENTEDSTSDFNMVMDMKLEEFKTYVIRELTESVKYIIQTEI